MWTTNECIVLWCIESYLAGKYFKNHALNPVCIHSFSLNFVLHVKKIQKKTFLASWCFHMNTVYFLNLYIHQFIFIIYCSGKSPFNRDFTVFKLVYLAMFWLLFNSYWKHSFSSIRKQSGDDHNHHLKMTNASKTVHPFFIHSLM